MTETNQAIYMINLFNLIALSPGLFKLFTINKHILYRNHKMGLQIQLDNDFEVLT